MDYVDVVDEDDKVVGKVPKDEAHKIGLLHRTVIAEVIGSDGNWTLIKQSHDRQDAGKIVSPVGGHVESGETEDEAIKREADEEYGLRGDVNLKLKGKAIYNREVIGRKENHYFILYEIYSDEKPRLNTESIGFKRFSKEKLAEELKSKPEKFGAAFHFVIKRFYPELLE